MDFYDNEKPGQYGYFEGDQPYIKLHGYVLWRAKDKKLTFDDFLYAYKTLSKEENYYS